MQTTEQRTHDRKRWDRVDLDQKTHKEDRSFEVGELRNQTSVDQESHAKKKKKTNLCKWISSKYLFCNQQTSTKTYT